MYRKQKQKSIIIKQIVKHLLDMSLEVKGSRQYAVGNNKYFSLTRQKHKH